MDGILNSSPRLPSSGDDVERVVKTEGDELRSSSIAMSSSPQKSPPPPAQTSSKATRPPARAPAGSNGAPANVRQSTQDKDTEKRPSRSMGISELTDGPFARFETQTEIVSPLQEHATREDSVRKGESFDRIYALFLPKYPSIDDVPTLQDLTSRLLLVLLETHAWLASRPIHERMNEIEKLEDEVKSFSEIEEQQGRSSSPVSAYSAHSYSTTATSVFVNYDPEIVVATSDEHTVERAREKLTQFVRHFTSAIQALAQGMTF